VYLDAPLGGRTVIDGFSGEEVPYKNVWIKIEERIGYGREETRNGSGG